MMTAAEAVKRAVDACSNVSLQIDKEVDRILEKIRDAASNGYRKVGVSFLPMIVGFDNEEFVVAEVVARLTHLGFGVERLTLGFSVLGCYDEYRLYHTITW